MGKISNFDEAIQKIASNINKKRADEILTFVHKKTWFSEYMKKVRNAGGSKPSKSKVWKKIAEMPMEVDHFFVRLYGPDYFKDKDFFKRFPEWTTTKDI